MKHVLSVGGMVVLVSIVALVGAATEASIRPPSELGTSIRAITLSDLCGSSFDEELITYNLYRLLTLGVNAIVIGVDWFAETERDPTLEPFYSDEKTFREGSYHEYTLRDEQIAFIADLAHSLGLAIILKLHIGTLDEPFEAAREDDSPLPIGYWDELFESYLDYALHYAGVCELLGVEIFCIGTERDAMTHADPDGLTDPDRRWRELIAHVRQHYAGSLTYSCAVMGSWTNPFSSPARVTFWDALDYIGAEFYRGLTDSNSHTIEQLRSGVRATLADFYSPLTDKYDRPIIITETNFMHCDGTNTRPYDPGNPPGDRMDLQEHADCYEALLSVVEQVAREEGYLHGVCLWNGDLVYPDDVGDLAPTDSCNGTSIWETPAEKVIRSHWYGSSDWERVGAPTISAETAAYPEQSAEAGCSVRLFENANTGQILVEAVPFSGWRFSHWDAPVDLPSYPMAFLDTEAELDANSLVVGAVFELREAVESPDHEAAAQDELQCGADLPIGDVLASCSDDLPVSAAASFARTLSEDELDGAVAGMAWNSPDPTDLTCWLNADIPADATGLRLVASSSVETQLRLCVAAGCHYMSDLTIQMSAQPEEFYFPYSSWSGHVVDACADPAPPSEWRTIDRLILFPAAGAGAFRIHSLQFVCDEASALFRGAIPLDDIFWFASYDDERGQSESNFAQIVHDSDENGEYYAMMWSSPEDTDLTIGSLSDQDRSGLIGVKLSLSASTPMDVLPVVSVSGEYCGKTWRYAAAPPVSVGVEPTDLVLSVPDFNDDPFTGCTDSLPTNAFELLDSIILLPQDRSGELRIYEVCLCTEERTEVTAGADTQTDEDVRPTLSEDGNPIAEEFPVPSAADPAVTRGELEYLGNPFKAVFPDGSGWEHARGVWDMQVFDDRIYLGHGSIFSNAGPIDVWAFDPAKEAFVKEFRVDEEVISTLYSTGDLCLIPGTDGIESWDFGSIYVHRGDTWTKQRTVPNAFHITTMACLEESIFVSAMIALMDEDGSEYYEGEVYESSDMGHTWTTVLGEDQPWVQLFVFDGALYGSTHDSGTFEFQGGQFRIIEDTDLFPGMEPDEDGRRFNIVRSVELGGKLAYYGVSQCPSCQPSSPLFVASEISVDGSKRAELLTETERVFDIVRADDVCWVVTNDLHDDQVASTARFYSSINLETWRLEAQLEAPTSVRSMELLDEYLYFGLGPGHPTEIYRDLAVGTGLALGDNSPHSGSVFRLLIGEDAGEGTQGGAPLLVGPGAFESAIQDYMIADAESQADDGGEAATDSTPTDPSETEQIGVEWYSSLTAENGMEQPGKASVLFDEAHNEANTISSERAQVIARRNPEWVLYSQLADTVSQDYDLARGLSPFTTDLLRDFDVVIISTPRAAFADDELHALRLFVEQGGGLLVLQDANPPAIDGSNQIAAMFGARFRGGGLYSHHGNWDAGSFPVDVVASSASPIIQSSTEFQMNWGCSIEESSEWEVLLQSRDDTWQEVNGNGGEDAGEFSGPLPVAAARSVGQGCVVLLADNALHDGVWVLNQGTFLDVLFWLSGRDPALRIDDVSGFKVDPDVTEESVVQIGADERFEYLGNPFAERFANGSGWEHARAVHDMQVFGGALYLAHGSAQSNPGSIDIWYWSRGYERFVNQFSTDEEEISHLAVRENTLLVPGKDATEGWDFGNLYQNNGLGWAKLRTLERAIHVESVHSEDGMLYACGVSVSPDGSKTTQMARVSSDGGLAWSDLRCLGSEEHETMAAFSLDGQVLLSGWLYDSDGGESTSAVFRVGTDGVYSLIPNLDLFPSGEEAEGEEKLPAYVYRIIPFEDGALYFGRAPAMDVESFAMNTSLYYATGLAQGEIRRIQLSTPNEEVTDLTSASGSAWVLTNELGPDRTGSTVRVYGTLAAQEWSQVLVFQSPVPVQSFEIFAGHMYFGLGHGHPHRLFCDTGVGSGFRLGDNNQECGDIYRCSLSELDVAFIREACSGEQVTSSAINTGETTENGGLTQLLDIEYLGNPFLEHHPVGSFGNLERTIWDMEIWDGKILFGIGNQATNPGPIALWLFDPNRNEFRTEFTVDEEWIGSFRIQGDTIYIPGSDSTESWDFGSIYRNDGSGWEKLHTIPWMVHVMDVAEHEGRLFVIGTCVFPEGNGTTAVAYSSLDDGVSWERIDFALDDEASERFGSSFLDEFPGNLFSRLLEFGGELLVYGDLMPWLAVFREGRFEISVTHPYPEVLSVRGVPCRDAPTDAVIQPIEERVQFLNCWQPCASSSLHRTAQFRGGLIYTLLGYRCINPACPRESFGIQYMTEVSSSGIVSVDTPNVNAQVVDVCVSDGWLYSLLNQSFGALQLVQIWRTDNLCEWDCVMSATSATAASSFAVVGDDIYIGLGEITEDSGLPLNYGDVFRLHLGAEQVNPAYCDLDSTRGK